MQEEEEVYRRLVKETQELSDKIAKLVAFIYSDQFKELPQGEKVLLNDQKAFMVAYESVLVKRIGLVG